MGAARHEPDVPMAPPRSATDLTWAAIAVLVPAILGLVSSIGAIDLAYHLRAGEEILSTRSLPRIDTYTFSVYGMPWVDQQWGAQVILSTAFDIGGWPLLVALQATLAAVSFAFIHAAARARGASARLAAVLTLGGFLIAYPMITLRPQLVALPLFGAAVWILATRHRHPGRVWAIPVLAAVAANIHGSFTLFPLIAGLAWLADLRDPATRSNRMLVVIGVTTLATLANPFGLGAWTYALDLSTDPIIRESITEWAPVDISNPLGALMIGSVLVVGVVFSRRTTQVRWLDLLTLGIFLLLALSAMRAILWWAIVAPVVLAGVFATGTDPRDDPDPDPAPRGPAFVIVGGLVVGILVLLPWWRGSSAEDQLEAAPPGITEALAQLPSGSRIFTYQPWGSWFIFALPDKPVFVDSRIEIVPEEIWQDYFQVAFARAHWAEALEEWQPDAVVGRGEEWEDIIGILREDPSWEVHYEDDDGVVFVPAS